MKTLAPKLLTALLLLTPLTPRAATPSCHHRHLAHVRLRARHGRLRHLLRPHPRRHQGSRSPGSHRRALLLQPLAVRRSPSPPRRPHPQPHGLRGLHHRGPPPPSAAISAHTMSITSPTSTPPPTAPTGSTPRIPKAIRCSSSSPATPAPSPSPPVPSARGSSTWAILVHNRADEDAFYRDLLGFRPYWYGAMKSDAVDWISQQVPDGHDWLEYMMVGDGSTTPTDHLSADHLGVLNHFSLGVANMEQGRHHALPAGSSSPRAMTARRWAATASGKPTSTTPTARVSS